jgi:hypothetical protein
MFLRRFRKQLTSAMVAQRAFQSRGNDDDHEGALERELSRLDTTNTGVPAAAAFTTDGAAEVEIHLEKLARPPGKYDLVTSTSVYKWSTTAKLARKIVGPMREWADEFKYRTGVHVDWDPVFPEKASSGGYQNADDVELNVYLFGAERAVAQSQSLMKAMIKQSPCYVRLAVFRVGAPASNEIQWLTLRRINRELRPPDIPPISLKTPGKHTLLFETPLEAAIRTLWEETGIKVDEASVFPTGMLSSSPSQYWWRPPVRYFIAQVPESVEVLGPQSNSSSYVLGWDPKLLRQSADPIERVWGTLADPQTGCCWLSTKQLDELQFPLKGERYTATRYTPPPHSGLQEVLGFTSA